MAPLIPIAIKLAADYGPGLLKALTGSEKAAEVAAQVVDVAQAVTGTSEPEKAAAAIQADPVLAIQFQQAMAQLEQDAYRAELADVQDARRRDLELAKLGQVNYRANIMIGAAVLLVLFCLLVIVWKSDLNEYSKGGITLILGRALGWVEQAFSFELGTTRSNKVKDETIKNLSK